MRSPLLAFALLLALSGCSSTAFDEGGAVVDVREEAGARHGAYRIPASEMSARYDELERYRALPLTVYGSTEETRRAVAVLHGQGFQAISVDIVD